MTDLYSRLDNRSFDQLRSIRITPNISEFAEGSALVEFGKTKVMCTASYDPKSPSWLQGSGKGWVTAEYGMLPRSTHQRMKREKVASGGRTQEISRLIGRSLRSAVNLKALNEKQILIDCDVLHADGGTRTAAITGGFVALALALRKLYELGEIKSLGLQNYISAVSVGLSKDLGDGKSQPLLDLNYEEDSTISTDMNFVMTDSCHFVEIQGTGEDTPFSRHELSEMMDVAEKGCSQLFRAQSEIVGAFFPLRTTQAR
jgi:ribonuclease PH